MGQLRGRRWERQAGDLAIRARVEDLRKDFASGIVVDADVVALFLEDGRIREVMESGNYTLETLLDRLRFWRPGRVVDIVLVARGPHAASFWFDEIATKDEQLARLTCELEIGVASAPALANLLLPGPAEASVADLCARIRPAMRMAAEGVVARETILEGIRNEHIAAALEPALSAALARFGFALGVLSSVGLFSDDASRLRADRGEDAVLSAEGHRLNRRAETLARLRDVLREDRTDSLHEERALERLLAEADRERLLEGHERERILRTLAEENRGRERTLELLEDEYQRTRRAAEAAFARSDSLEEANAIIERQTRAHSAEQELRSVEHRRDVEEARDGIELLRELKRAKRETRLAEESGALDLEERRRSLAEAEKRRAQQLELERLRTVDALGTDTKVLAAADGERARILEQLARGENAANLSPEQLLALVADRSPEAAAALSRGDAPSSEELRGLYERMLSVTTEAYQGAQETMRDLATQAMVTQASVAREASRNAAVRAEKWGRRRVEACPNGEHTGSPEDRFCPRCGTTLR